MFKVFNVYTSDPPRLSGHDYRFPQRYRVENGSIRSGSPKYEILNYEYHLLVGNDRNPSLGFQNKKPLAIETNGRYLAIFKMKKKNDQK